MVPKVYNDVSAGDLDAGLAYTTKLLIQGLGKNALRRHIIYIAEDGLRVLDDKGKDDLWSPCGPHSSRKHKCPGAQPKSPLHGLETATLGLLKAMLI